MWLLRNKIIFMLASKTMRKVDMALIGLSCIKFCAKHYKRFNGCGVKRVSVEILTLGNPSLEPMSFTSLSQTILFA